jgi:hypothetical protein
MREWGMMLHWGSRHLSECLPEPIQRQLSCINVDPFFVQGPDASTAVPVYNGKTGELITMMEGDNPRRVSRRKMRSLFAQGLDIQVVDPLRGMVSLTRGYFGF